VRTLFQRLVTCALLVVAAACSNASRPRPALVNPIAFPLYRNSDVLTVRSWHRTLTPGERAALGVTGPSGDAYSGHEVLAATVDSFDDVTTWLQGLNNLPPDGYRVAVWGSGVDEARMNARNMGVDFDIFMRKERGVPHDVVVIAVDPDLVQRKAGIMISLLSRFKSIPPFLRSAVDAQAKAQTGFTVSDAIDPATPLGIAFDSLERLHDAHARGVILVDTRPVSGR
jgi:hypothetical protein